MRIGIFSDLHLDHAAYIYDFEQHDDVDLWINAGDTATAPLLKNYFIEKVLPKQFWIDGNHDLYSHSVVKVVSDPDSYCVTHRQDGILIAGAPLWTDLSNGLDWHRYRTQLIDCKYIEDWTFEKYMWHHCHQKDFLLSSGADIIVSHHLPSYLSINAKWIMSDCNSSFAVELSDRILSMPKPPKLWVHGHSHDSCDYMIGETRVISNPRGYPGEGNFRNYKPIFVDI